MPELFNVHGFGPPHPFTGTSTWPWVDHLVSGLPPTTYRPIQTRFRYGSAPKVLNPPLKVTRRSIMQKVRGHTQRLEPGN